MQRGYSASHELREGEAGRLTPIGVSPTALVASLAVIRGPAICYGLIGHNTGPAQFVQVHDAADVPADGAIPETVLNVPADTNFSIDYGPKGRAFLVGIAVCNSSTVPTKTVGAADCWFDVIYR